MSKIYFIRHSKAVDENKDGAKDALRELSQKGKEEEQTRAACVLPRNPAGGPGAGPWAPGRGRGWGRAPGRGRGVGRPSRKHTRLRGPRGSPSG